ncbi:hypothetical protein LOZ39_004249 [Ophidiomyces ophidiicola]|uniref:Uncharacterized protein n=1 Tax=Ophidiomyces ophidiicola TaxID=1387563 RepID=A0ACB8UW87_9EURO|nr:hypothetical protein LOZ64_006779 [Ophidiomyces ophidiicola]KAI1926270.1 hypothetical protein LOZ60_003646 [Ophidiomyces ophidiicola]KAI2001462.1 hypothetical protein LOZ49_006628 [Ophidiomyces ophidiicola]KAI2005185.1 hypothetical protein LOZ50_003806 [Ophidiomyces ophidiicola]KAI2012776.1 hypothetical protein LOZ46_005950 [Ophidiomyces ophidiicola]
MGLLFKLLAGTLALTSVVDAGDLLNFENQNNVIPNSYIVVMKDGTSSSDFDSHKNWAARVHRGNLAKRGSSDFAGLKFSFDIEGWRGYSGKFDSETIKEIVNHANVAYVEPDRMASGTLLYETQKDAPTWGLGRVSHIKRGSSDYVYHRSAGEGVTAYIVDTGIDITHPEFEGRAEWGTNVVDEVPTDEHGHGTHVAGTIVSKTYGVAKKAKVIAVKALGKDSRGPDSGIIAAMDWAVKHAKERRLIGKAVMNLSLTGDTATALNAAAENAVKAGLFLGVAAGNANRDAINESPASVKSVCTAAASSIDDTKASFSNFGSLIDVYAPGNRILSTLPGNRTGIFSGTSMAAPHVCGVAALLMSSAGVPPQVACDAIKALAHPAITNPGVNTTAKLLYNASFQ